MQLFSGNHSADSVNFEHSQTSSLVSRSKFTESYESTTAIPSVVDSANAESNATQNSQSNNRSNGGVASSRFYAERAKIGLGGPLSEVLHKNDSNEYPRTNCKQDNAQGLFLAIHLMGSQTGYANRYPKSFERFTPRDIKDNPNFANLSTAQKSRAKADLAQYANSILYTDFVLREIIKRFESSDSIVIYFSDHANDVWHTGVGSLRVDSKITRFMVEIPFVVFISDKFKELHPEIYTKIAKSTHKPFMIDDLIHALIDIAGFQIDGFESNRSLFSDDFNANRVRTLSTKANINYTKMLQ